MLTEVQQHEGYWTFKADGWFYSVDFQRCPQCKGDQLSVKMMTWEDTGAGNLGDMPIFHCAECKAQVWPEWAAVADEVPEQLTYLDELF